MRVTDGTEELTLYRDAAGSKEDVTLYVFGNDLEACFKR